MAGKKIPTKRIDNFILHFRHVLISEISAAVSQLPPSVNHAAVMSWDPLPPANSINTYVAPSRQPTVLGNQQGCQASLWSLYKCLAWLADWLSCPNIRWTLNQYLNPFFYPITIKSSLDDPNALGMFFRSILPNFNPLDPLPAAEEGAVGGQQPGTDLRHHDIQL